MMNAARPLAHPAMEIRSLETAPEFDACIRLQQSVWQFPDIDIIPRRMFIVAQAIGGQVLGAWEGERLAGYALAIPAMRDLVPYLHSHMLAVDPEYRNRGIGVRLKLAQREYALAKGIDRIEWTFDPTQIKNAYLNVEKLGAIARRYAVDFYGKSNSPLHGGLPTDRLYAEWHLRSKRVAAILAGNQAPPSPVQATVAVTYSDIAPNGTLQPSPAGTLTSLLAVRNQLTSLFASHLAVLRFQLVSNVEGRYLLGPIDEARDL